MPIEESLNLDLGPALSAIRGELKREIEGIPSTLRDSFGTALVGMADDVGAFAEIARDEIDRVLGAPIETGPVEIPVDVDTTELDAVPGEVDAAGSPVEVPVEVDATQLDELESQIEEIAGTDVAIDAQVDSAGIERAAEGTEELGKAAEQASVDFGGLSNNVATVVSGVADLGKFTGAGGVLGILTVGAVGFASAAIDSDSATRSFNARVGDLAETLNRVGPGVAGLNESLADFALRIGADDDALRLALASFVQLGTSSGKSRAELGQLGQQLTAISGYLSVLNPELGSASDIAERLPNAFARGERGLRQFGLAITSAAIEQRALQDNVGKTAEELTLFDKTAAGLALTFEQLGPKIASGIDAGVEAPAIKIRQLRTVLDETFESTGAELIDPLVRSLSALTPVLVEVAGVLGQTAGGFADILVPILEVAAPLLESIADSLGALPGPFLAAGTAALLFSRHMQAAAVASEQAATATAAAGAAAGGAGSAFRTGGAGTVVALAVVGSALLDMTEHTVNAREEFEKLSSVADEDLLGGFREALGEDQGILSDADVFRMKEFKNAFKDLAEQAPETAARVVAALKSAGIETKDYERILGDVATANEEAEVAAVRNSKAVQDQVDALSDADPIIARQAANTLKQSLAYEKLDPEIKKTVDSIIALAEEEENAEKKAADLAKAEADLEAALSDARQEFEDLNDAVSDSLGLYDEMAGKQRSLRDADIDWNDALIKLNKSVKDNGKDWRIWTEAGIENNRALDDVTDKAAGVIAQLGDKFPTSVAGFNTASGIWRDELLKQAGALGVPRDRLQEMQTLIDTLRLNEEVNIRINVAVQSGLNVTRAGLNNLGQADPEAVAQILGLHEGGVVRYATGGREDHSAFIGNGTTRIFDEPETGGEAYIPLAQSKRERSTAILADVAGEFGFALSPTNRQQLSVPAEVGGSGGTAVLERIASLLDALPGKIPAGINANVELSVQEADVLGRLAERLRGRN